MTLWLSSPHLAIRIGREGKSKAAVTHLALLGVKRQETAFWGLFQRKSSADALLFLAIKSKAPPACKEVSGGLFIVF